MAFKDPEREKAYKRAYAQAHREERAARERINRKKRDAKDGGAKRREAERRSRQANAEKIAERRRAYRQGNEEYARKHAERQRRYKLNHPEVRQAGKARRRQRVFVALTTEERAESAAWRKLIKDDPCFYCGAPKTHHVDHYTSLANGGTDHWWNLVRACSPCNLRKNRMNGDDFLRLLGESRDDLAS